MNKDLIFREPVYNSENQFMYFHYWGFKTEEGSNFTGPTTPTNRIKPKQSEKYIGLIDKNNTRVHEGDIICFNEKYGKKHIKYGIVKGGVRGYCFDIDCGDSNYNSSAYHLITDESHQGHVVGNIHQGIRISSKQCNPVFIDIINGKSILRMGSSIGPSMPDRAYIDRLTQLSNIKLNDFNNLEEAILKGAFNTLELNNTQYLDKLVHKPLKLKLNLTEKQIEEIKKLDKKSGEIKLFNESMYENTELTDTVITGMIKQLENKESN